MSRVYKVMDAFEAKTLEVTQTGRYSDGCKDIYCCICDNDFTVIAETEFEEIDDAYMVTEWVAGNGFVFAENAERFAAHVIGDALIDEACSVNEAASRAWCELEED